MPNKKEVLDLTKIADQSAVELSDAVTNVGARQLLPNKVYAMITSRLGLKSDIFTAFFSVSQNAVGGRPGLGQIDRSDQIGNLNPEISVAEHIEAIVAHHPEAGIILDQETAITLSKDKYRPTTLIEYDNGHCLLTGLNQKGIDVYLTCSMDIIRAQVD